MKTLLFLIIPIFFLSWTGDYTTQQQVLYQNPSDTIVTNVKIYFENGSVKINTEYYGNQEPLIQVAQYLKKHSDVVLAVIGSSKVSASLKLNEFFAYQRAKNTIEWFKQNHAVDSSRFIILYEAHLPPLCAGSPFRQFQSVTFKLANGSEINMPDPREN